MRSPTAQNLLTLALLSVVVAVTFSRPLHGPFIYDDYEAVAYNETIRQLSPLSLPLSPPTDTPFAGRPLVNYSFAVNYALGELDPAGFRVMNLGFHAISAWVLFLLVKQTLAHSPVCAGEANHAGALALCISVVWAVHPLHTESVCYITQRTELMFSLFYLSTLLFSARCLTATRGGSRIAWGLAAVLACLSGMASKEAMVSAPLMVLIYDRAFVHRSLPESLRRGWLLYVGLALTWGLLAYLMAEAPRSKSAGFHLEVAAVDYWMTQCKVLWMYLRLVIWPWPLSVHYKIPYLTSLSESWMYVVPTAVLIGAVAVALRRNWPCGALGAWFFAVLSPTLVVPIVTEVVAERRMYLPLAALTCAVVVGGFRLLAASPRRVAQVAGASAALTVMLAVVSYVRIGEFQDHLSYWSKFVEQHPDSGLAQYNLGITLKKAGRLEEALIPLAEAIKIDPNDVDYRTVTGNTLRGSGRYDEAVAEFRTAIALGPEQFLPRLNLAITYSVMGRESEARTEYEWLVSRYPDDAKVRADLGTLLLELGDPAAALPHLQIAVKSAPNHPTYWNNLGSANLRTEQASEAVRCYGEVVRLEPELAIGHHNLAEAQAAAGNMKEALDSARRARELAVAQNEPEIVKAVDELISKHQQPESLAPESTPSPNN